MAQGQKTGGRIAGTPNKRTAELLAEVEATGVSPLGYMLSILQNEEAAPKDRQWAADKSAAYIHPKPMPQPRTVAFDLPGDTSTPTGISQALDAILKAAAAGQLAPSEAKDITGLLECRLKAIEVVTLEERIARLESRSSQ